MKRVKEAGGWVCLLIFHVSNSSSIIGFAYLSLREFGLKPIHCFLYNQIVNGRICGDIAVSRAFGDIRFKTKKNELGSFSSHNGSSIFIIVISLLIRVSYTVC